MEIVVIEFFPSFFLFCSDEYAYMLLKQALSLSFSCQFSTGAILHNGIDSDCGMLIDWYL